MSKLAYKRLADTVQQREWMEGRAEIDEMTDLYEGQLPSRFDQYFPKSEPKHIINLVRLAHDDLATTIGRLPDLRGEPNNASNAELERIGLLEDIGKDYLRISEPDGKQFMWQLAWWLLIRQAVAIVIPDEEKGKPKFSLRDPRTAYPGVKKRIGNVPVELSDVIFKYEVPTQEAIRMGFEPATETNDRTGEVTLQTKTNMIEMIDDMYWIMVSEGGTAKIGVHGLGKVPAYVFQDFSPNKPHGLGQFSDQISLMVAISRMVTQKLAFADRLIYPVYWVKGHEGNIKMGPYILNKLAPQGEMGVLGPPATLQADRDIQQLERFSRLLNRNPEVRQGEIQTKGSYTSAKTLEQLNEAIDTVVGRYWDIIGTGLEYLFECAFRMDEKLFDYEKAVRSGYFKGRPRFVNYTPTVNIAGNYHISVDYGFGIGGYQGFLQNLQAHEAGMISRRRVVESMPGVSDVDEELRTIELEKMDEAGQVQFQTLAAQGQLDTLLWSKLRKEMARKGTPLAEIIEKYQEEIQAQAQAAMQQGGAEALTAAPGPEGPPAEEPMPGLPPAALVA